jgi:hypothetical protein
MSVELEGVCVAVDDGLGLAVPMRVGVSVDARVGVDACLAVCANVGFGVKEAPAMGGGEPIVIDLDRSRSTRSACAGSRSSARAMATEARPTTKRTRVRRRAANWDRLGGVPFLALGCALPSTITASKRPHLWQNRLESLFVAPQLGQRIFRALHGQALAGHTIVAS